MTEPQEVRTWCKQVIRDLPEQALHEVVHMLTQIQDFYKKPLERHLPPRGK